MKFQPGQSGNPAGRPLGARNKKTLAMEEEAGKHAEEAFEIVMRRARGGDPTCLRLLMARIMPTGIDRPLALELPKVESAGDAQKALDMVIEAFGRGAITVRELPTMLGSVDRMARVAQRIDAMREGEKERYKAQRVHGIHPDLMPKPTGEPDPYEVLTAAIERGENPFPDDPAKLAYILEGEELFPSVNSASKAAASPAEQTATAVEPGASAGEDLHLPVNLQEAPPSQSETHFEGDMTAARDGEAVSEPPAPSLPRERSERGEGGDPGLDPGEPGGGLSSDANTPEEDALHSPVNYALPPDAADAAPPSSMGEITENDSLYSPVNSGAGGDEPVALEHRPELSGGRRLVSALVDAEGRPMPVYLDLKPDPDPLAEVWRMVESVASDADPPHLNSE